MIEELATVTAKDGSYVWVQTQRQSACDSCSAQKGCGTSAVGKVVGKQYTQVRVLNQLQAQVGDLVKVAMHEDLLVKSSIAVYLIPLVLMLLGGVIADEVLISAYPHWHAVVGSIAGLAVGSVWLRFYAQRMAKNVRFQPVIQQIVQSAPQQSHAIYTP